MWWFGCRESRTRTVADVNVKIEPELSQTHQCSIQDQNNALFEQETVANETVLEPGTY